MKKNVIAVMILVLVLCFTVPAAAETYTSSNGVLSIELPNENWKEITDPGRWITLSDGGSMITIDHYSNGEKLPDIAVANEHYVNVYQAVFSTQNEVFIITASVVDSDRIPEITQSILSAKVLQYNTKLAVKKESQASVSEFTVEAVDQTWYVTADSGLNVRLGCSTDEQIVGSLGYGSSVRVTGIIRKNGEDYGWRQVEFEGGTGYVASNFLSATKPQPKPASKDDSGSGSGGGSTPSSGAVKTVYDEYGQAYTLYEGLDGYWRDKSGTAYVRLSASEFQVLNGTKRVFTYDPSYTPAPSDDYLDGVVTAYGEDGTAYMLYQGSDGYWRDRSGDTYVQHSPTDFQILNGNKHLTVY